MNVLFALESCSSSPFAQRSTFPDIRRFTIFPLHLAANLNLIWQFVVNNFPHVFENRADHH
ncbi:MAG: hypothetical protein ACREIC_22675, partial [Limisphaerales bacterium]